jgi:hypothetical protein
VFEWHGSSSVGLHKTQLLGFDLIDFRLVFGLLPVCRPLHSLDAGQDGLADLRDPLGAWLNRPVVLDHRLLDGLDRHPARTTLAAVMLAPDAIEVLIGRAVAVLGFGVDEAMPTGTAVDRPLEPVVMKPALIA